MFDCDKVLAVGRPPEPPPEFEPTLGVNFDPLLAKLKLLISGQAPQPPPNFHPTKATLFDPPVAIPVDKVLASGVTPQPPPQFDPALHDRLVFHPPLPGGPFPCTCAATAGSTVSVSQGTSLALQPSAAAAHPAAAADSAVAPPRGYRIKKKSMS